MSKLSNNAREIFLKAIEGHQPDDWSGYLDEACGDDADLRDRVEKLLRAHQDLGTFAEQTHSVVNGAGTATEKPGDIVGHYKLLQEIGEGGMGVVYMAEQFEPVDRRVALKVIKPGMDTRKVIARFEAERQALAMMDHPNIAKVHDAGTTVTGRPYFVMELVKGVPITEYCDQHLLSPRERLELFVPVCRAVQHAHQKGVIHRDIKPSNVLVSRYDGKPVPKIIDFGVAKAIQQRLTEKTVFTEFGQIVGTIDYMSPEQAEFNQLDIDTRTDVYSLGVLLYELLAGETPFDRERLRDAAFDEMLRIIREEEPPKPSQRLTSSGSLPSIAANRHVEPARLSNLVRGELDWIVMKSLEKDRTRRYETADKLAEDVEHYLKDEAVAACPPSTGYRFRKFARRNKPLIVTSAAIAAALVVGTGVATWQAIRATQERDRAMAAEVKAEKETERADGEAKNAKAEAAIAKAVSDFLRLDLLRMAAADSQAAAGLSPDPNIKLRTLLDRAAERIDERFADQPHLEATIRITLGDAYHSIGDYQKAELHFQKAVDLHKQVLGQEDVTTIASINGLACAYRAQGRHDEAEILFRQTLEIGRRVLGVEHQVTLTILNNLALVYQSKGLYEDAEKLHIEALAKQKRTLGDEHPDVLRSVDNLARVYSRQGRYDEAEELQRQNLETTTRTLGKEHPATLEAMFNLAVTYHDQAHYDAAETLHRQTLEIRRRTLGDDHTNTISSINGLANVLKTLSRYEEAERLYANNFKLLKLNLGAEHPDTLAAAINLANTYSRQGRFEEAENLHRQNLEIFLRTLGDVHPHTLLTMGGLAKVYSHQGRYKQAEDIHEEAIEIERRTLGDEHPHTVARMNTLGEIYRQQGRYDEAEQLLLKTLDIRRRVLGGEHAETGSSLSHLGNVYVSQRRFDKAERLYRDALGIRRRVLGPEHPATLGTMDNLAVAISGQDRDAEAEELHNEILEIRRRVLGPEHPDTLKSILNCCKSAFRQGQYDKAEQISRDAVDIHRRVLGPEHPETLRTINNLAVALSRQDRYAEAEQLHRNVFEIRRRLLGPEHPDTLSSRDTLTGICSHLSWQSSTSPDPTQCNPQKAVEWARKAIELRSEKANHWDKLGVALYRNGQLDEAIEALEKARDMRNGSDRYHQIFLVKAYWQDGRYDEAVENYVEVAKWLFSGQRAAEQYRFRDEAQALFLDSPEEMEMVLKAVSEDIERRPDDRALRAVRAGLYAATQAWEKSAADWARVIDLTEDPRAWPSPRQAVCREIAATPELFDHVAQLRPDEPAVWIGRGQYHVLRSQWAKAASDYARAAPLQPVADKTYQYAGLLLLIGDEQGYRKYCAELSTLADEPGFLLARSCAIGPESGVEPDRIIDWAKQGDTAWELHVLGLAQYRAGMYVEAIQSLKASNAGTWPALAKSQNELVLAMAYHDQGEKEKAEELLKQATKTIDHARPQQADEPVDVAIPDWIGIETLRREAEGLIELPGDAAEESERSDSNELKAA